MASISVSLQRLKDRPALLSFLSTAILIVTPCLAFDICWETVDDLHMSMIAHGYGIASYGSPNLLCSNVLWGHWVRILPSINGILGYSLATMAVLLVAGWAMFYFLLLLGAGYPLSLLVAILVIARPTLLPQFTINAGLLTVAAVMGWWVYARFKNIGSLVAACLLAFMGCLIRSLEFFLVLGVALPLLPWQALLRQRSMQIALAILALAIVLATAIDHRAYSGPEWKVFNEVNPTWGPFTDLGAATHLKQRPDILARHGYSGNDIELIHNANFVDPKIADPKALNAMLAELGPLFLQKESFALGFKSIKTLIAPELLPLLLPGLFFLFIRPRKSVVLAWAICLMALFVIGMTGKPGIVHIYVPLLGLLLVAPFAFGEVTKGALRWMAVLMLFVACVGSVYQCMPIIVTCKFGTREVRRTIQLLPRRVIFLLEASIFPWQLAFPVLSSDPEPRKMRLDPLYIFTYAPFSVSMAEQKAGRGLIERLLSAGGVPVITSARTTAMMDIYCRERLHGDLESLTAFQSYAITVKLLRCVTAQSNVATATSKHAPS